MTKIKERNFEQEFKFKASLSTGKGGQHVNKVMTKVELVFNLPKSKILNEDEKVLLNEKLENRLSAKGDLRIVCDESRSQLKNKKISIEKFYELIEKSLKRPKRRKPTAPSRQAIETRVKSKKIISVKKQSRKKVDLNSAD